MPRQARAGAGAAPGAGRAGGRRRSPRTEATGWVVGAMKSACDYAAPKGIRLGVGDRVSVSQNAGVCLDVMHRVNLSDAGIILDITHLIAAVTRDACASVAACIPFAHIRDHFDEGTPIDLDHVWCLYAKPATTAKSRPSTKVHAAANPRPLVFPSSSPRHGRCARSIRVSEPRWIQGRASERSTGANVQLPLCPCRWRPVVYWRSLLTKMGIAEYT